MRHGEDRCAILYENVVPIFLGIQIKNGDGNKGFKMIVFFMDSKVKAERGNRNNLCIIAGQHNVDRGGLQNIIMRMGGGGRGIIMK